MAWKEFFSSVASDLFGIMNGVDYGEWNPETDPYLNGNNYGVNNVAERQGGVQSRVAARRWACQKLPISRSSH